MNDAAHATLSERAIEAVKHAGTNPYDWDLTDDVADAAENGLTVTRLEMARAMIEVALDTVEDELVDECDEELRCDLRRRRLDIEEIRQAIELDARGLSVGPHYLRDWLRVQGISAEGRCRGCQGGTAALCSDCQRAVLAPTLVASVATTDRKVA